MKTEQEYLDFCVAKLAEEGIAATIIPEPEAPEVPTISVPAWETESKLLCRKTVYQFIHDKLKGQRDKGFQSFHPGTGAPLDVYCYNPDRDGDPDKWDLLIWNNHGNTVFDWCDLVEGDDSAWPDGWEIGDVWVATERVLFLHSILSYVIIDLPEIQALEREEIVAELKAHPQEVIFCHAPDWRTRWCLDLNKDGELHLFRAGIEGSTPVDESHFVTPTRLAFEGHVYLTRSMGFSRQRRLPF
ncbi:MULTISPECIES: hypothetical protein [Pseudomonas]|jgi:hypothetical protein|uniref:hypothetical protein n=1 Tax=Pseudomonas TaxID=286 RepID=UPI0018E8C13E|nr:MULTISPECIES: hypothetical protein [Pseudomonas]MBJ2214106.1 hypothetical protein [Pseudomonas carnis]MBP5947974.1 hypothetical protein [Pseudomonas sp. P9(2020)]